MSEPIEWVVDSKSHHPGETAPLGNGFRAYIERPNTWRRDFRLTITYAGFAFADSKSFKSMRGAKSFVEKNRDAWR